MNTYSHTGMHAINAKGDAGDDGFQKIIVVMTKKRDLAILA